MSTVWYFAREQPTARWVDVKVGFERAFFPLNYRVEMGCALRNRTQRQGKSLRSYFYSVLCDKVDESMADEKRKEYVEIGMLPHFHHQIALLRPSSLDHLRELIDVCDGASFGNAFLTTGPTLEGFERHTELCATSNVEVRRIDVTKILIPRELQIRSIIPTGIRAHLKAGTDPYNNLIHEPRMRVCYTCRRPGHL